MIARPGMKGRAIDVGIVLLGLGAAACLMWRGSALPRSWLSALDQSAYWILLTAALVAAFARTGSGAAPSERRRWRAWGLASTLVLFSLPVAYLWASGRTTYPAIGGFLPWSDAAGYHFGAAHLLNDLSLDDFSMRRPLNAAFLAARLGLLGGSLQASLAVQTWLTGGAAFLAAAALARSHGLGSGLLSLALLYELARPYVGTTFSECLGLTYGCLGFAACWAAAAHIPGRGVALGSGAALLTLGLCARAGAYAMLPALVLWAAFAFRPRPAWRPAAWAIAGVGLGLLLNASLYWQFGNEKGMANANFAEVAYGVAAGGVAWPQALIDHPECRVASESDRAHCIYARVFERLRTSPGTAVRGYWVGLQLYGGRMFGFLVDTSSSLWRPEAHRDRWTQPLLLVLAGMGVLCALRRRDDPQMSQLLVTGLAVFCCAPFLTAGEARVYAATLPYTFALPAVGLAWLGRLASSNRGSVDRPHGPSAERAPQNPSRAVLGLGVALAIACSAGPAVAIAVRDRPRFAPLPCSPGLVPVIFNVNRDSVSLHVLADLPGSLTQVPQVRYVDWRADPSFSGNEAGHIWREVQPGDWVIRGYDHTFWRPVRKRHFWMVVPANVGMPSTPLLGVRSHRHAVGLASPADSRPAAVASGLLVVTKHLTLAPRRLYGSRNEDLAPRDPPVPLLLG